MSMNFIKVTDINNYENWINLDRVERIEKSINYTIIFGHNVYGDVIITLEEFDKSLKNYIA